MYFIMVPDNEGRFMAKPIATAPTSTQARRLAFELNHTLFGRTVGRVFYLDQESYIRWRVAGQVAATDPLPEPDPSQSQLSGNPA
jgi:hypothetical protein